MEIENICPGCLKKLITVVPGDKHLAGDLTVCGNCAIMLEFDENLSPLVLTIDKFNQLSPSEQTELNETVYLIVNMHK